MKFKIGDRVTRRKDVYNQKSPLMHGVVTKVYYVYPDRTYPALYDVKWDGEKVGEACLPRDIDREGVQDV